MFLTQVNYIGGSMERDEHMFSFRLDTTSDDLKLILYSYRKVQKKKSVDTYSELSPRCLNTLSIEDVMQTRFYTQAVEDAKQNIRNAL